MLLDMVDGSYRHLQASIEEIRAAREACLERAVVARRDLVDAQTRYEDAVLEATDLGVPAALLARRCGLSEAAIRLFVKRRKDKK